MSQASFGTALGRSRLTRPREHRLRLALGFGVPPAVVLQKYIPRQRFWAAHRSEQTRSSATSRECQIRLFVGSPASFARSFLWPVRKLRG